MAAIGTLGWIQVDCADPTALARFWSEVLGFPIDDETLGEPVQYVSLVGPRGHAQVSFQRVPEPKAGKNRLHLDVVTDDLETAADRVEALGGSRAEPDPRHEYGYDFRVMADPEGNEFCLILA